MAKAVWILGAGFSIPLGGPTLNQLLDWEEITHLVAAEIAPTMFGPTFERFREIFDPILRVRGLAASDRGTMKTKISSSRVPGNAEQFLVTLGRAILELEESETPQGRQGGFSIEVHDTLKALQVSNARDLLTTLKSIDVCARYLVGLQCDFVRRATQIPESWIPYSRWATDLVQSGDAILSFNYDGVVEEAFVRAKVQLHQVSLDSTTSPVESDMPQLLKLHGSFDWREQTGDDFKERYGLSDVPLIAIPGPDKLNMTREGGRLAPIWERAAKHLTDAERIMIVGYRFPDSDVHALRTLCDAMIANENPKTWISVTLGNDLVSRQRLDAILGWVQRRRKLRSKMTPIANEPLFTQDFLTLASRED